MGWDDEMPDGELVNALCEALHEVDEMVPGCPVATWRSLYELLGLDREGWSTPSGTLPPPPYEPWA